MLKINPMFKYAKIEYLFISICGIVSLFCLAVLTLSMDKNIDFTDESYYLLHALWPREVSGSVRLFGFYSNLLLRVSGMDLHVFRAVGALLLWLFAGFSCVSMLRLVVDEVLKPKYRIMVFFLGSLSSLAFYYLWITSPSYNYFTLLSILGVIIFWSNWIKNPQSKFHLPLICFFGFLCLVSKPTSAMLLGMAFFILNVLLFRDRITLKNFSICFSTIGICVLSHVYILDGGFFVAAERFLFGVDLMGIFSPRYGIWSAFDLFLTRFIPHFFMAVFDLTSLGVISCTIVLLYLVQKFYTNNYLINTIFVLSTASVIFLLRDTILEFPRLTNGTPTVFVWIKIAVASFMSFSFYVIMINRNNLKTVFKVFVVLLTPFIFHFGSTNPITYNTVHASILIFLPLLVLSTFILVNYENHVPIFISTILIAGSIYNSTIYATQRPYRQSNLSKLNYNLSVSPGDKISINLKVSKELFEFITEFRNTLNSSGFNEMSSNLIELTGAGPGFYLFSNGRFLGQPWHSGGYKGSLNFVSAALAREEKETLQSAWYITCEKCKRRIPSLIWEKLKLPKLEESHIKVATIYYPLKERDIIIWKPQKSSR